MQKKSIKENEFFGAPGGAGGTVNYGQSYGTFSSPDVKQNPDAFYNSNNNKAIGPNSNTTSLNPDSGSLSKDIEQLYSKKETPTPDEIVTGIKHEMGQQIKKDKQAAKRIVIDNLKKNPKYYSELGMLNIDDKTMMDNVNEQKSAQKKATKQIFEDLAKARDNRYVVNSGISDVMKQAWTVKQQRNAWKNGKTE